MDVLPPSPHQASDVTKKCAICDCVVIEEDGVTVTRGISAILLASERRQDGKYEVFKNAQVLYVHKECRKQYTRENSIAAAERELQTEPEYVSPVKGRLRLYKPAFDYKELCLFCSEECSEVCEVKKPVVRRRKIHKVSTLPFRENILEKADEIIDTVLGKEVKYRVSGVVDLVAEEAVYHGSCMKDFFSTVATSGKKGRPESRTLSAAFDEVCSYIESSDECQFGLNELIDKMGDCKPTEAWFKKMLESKFGEDIIITTVHKKIPVVCFRGTGYKILSETWYSEKQASEEDERLRIVRTAAAIIREDLRSQVYDTQHYPPGIDFLKHASSDVPTSLSAFLQDVVMKGRKGNKSSLEVKCQCIAHSIISAVRPRSFISSIQLGLSVYLHRKYGSKLLLDITSHLGYCSPYNDAILYEASAIMSKQPSPQAVEGTFIQYVFDNADFDINTIDGRNTFHSMGGIQCITPQNLVPKSKTVDRLKTIPSAQVLASRAHVATKTFVRNSESHLKSLEIKDLSKLRILQIGIPLQSYSELLWLTGKWLGVSNLPGWSGYMESITKSLTCERSEVRFLPFVNLKANTDDAVNTVLHFASEQCSKLNQGIGFVTFDQPLYARAREILLISSDQPDLSNIVVRLGGFHLLMSFLGAVGYIMDGSGLTELWSTIYAQKSIDKMMSGHSFARALRAHFLTQLSLCNIVMNDMNISVDQRSEIKQLLSDCKENPPVFDTVAEMPILEDIQKKFHLQVSKLNERGHTAQLWTQYIDMISLVRSFIQAERMGDWNVHTSCVQRMIPYFHAAGHLSYAKSAHLYLQDMYDLVNKMSAEEFRKFTELGFFTIRRTDKFWSGVWTDMTVEQTLMRLMKTSGGLTHGRGISPSVLARWILGMPSAMETCNSVEEFAGVRSEGSEQHVDMRKSRISRDASDVCLLGLWFEAHPPFPEQERVMSIATGIIGDASINCFKSYSIGESAMKTMIGQSFGDVKLRRNDRVLPLSTVSSGLKVTNTVVPVNTSLLFQRIIRTVRQEEELKTCFKYELSPVPTSLFQGASMRKTKKSALYNVFEPTKQQVSLDDAYYVVDGGFLLHRVVWPQPATYNDVLEAYTSFVVSHYGLKCTVVFDGYSSSRYNVKNAERLRRASQKTCADIIFEGSMNTTIGQSIFLSNDRNKSRFIDLLSTRLIQRGVEVKQAPDDADTLIVSTGVEATNFSNNVFVVGEDVDLLVLMMTLSPDEKDICLLKPGRGRTETRVYSCKELKLSHKDIRNHLFFVHATSGCDSTSALFHMGKAKFLKVLRKNKQLQSIVGVFNESDASPDDVAQAGESFLLSLYGAPKNETSLNDFRFQCFNKAVAKSKNEVKLANLPPTQGASRQHFLRVYYQVQLWRGVELSPDKWGWEMTENGLQPVTSLEPAAPEMLIKLISCNCTKGCTKACSCRKAGLKCSNICGECKGFGCTNAVPYDAIVDTEDDDAESDADEDILSDLFEIGEVHVSSDYYDDYIETDQVDTIEVSSSLYVKAPEILCLEETGEEMYQSHSDVNVQNYEEVATSSRSNL